MQSKVTGLSGGIELLVSCGFQAVAEVTSTIHSVSISRPDSSAPSISISPITRGGSGSALERGLFSLLSPHSDWTVWLVMEEPPIDSLLPPPAPSSTVPQDERNARPCKSCNAYNHRS